MSLKMVEATISQSAAWARDQKSYGETCRNQHHYSLRLALLFLGFWLYFHDAYAALDELALGWRVPLEPRTETVETAEKAFAHVVAGLSGKMGIKSRSFVTGDGEFILWGDLFHTGGCFMLAELSPQKSEDGPVGFIFAEWADGVWMARQLWDIPITWRSADWKNGDEDYLPTSPATDAFILRDFDGDGRPEVIVAGEVNKYYQANYLLRFNPKAHELSALNCSYGPPIKLGAYVCFYSNSGRRSIYEDWDFCAWQGNDLKTIASWHEETPYNNIDPSFIEATLPCLNGTDEVIRISDTDLQPSFGFPVLSKPDWENDYLVTTAQQPFGKLKVVWKPWIDVAIRESGETYDIEHAWMFERITGMSRQLYPTREMDLQPLAQLERFADVVFEDDPRWNGQLSTAHNVKSSKRLSSP